MPAPDPHELVRQLIAGDPRGADDLAHRASTSSEPIVLVVAALTRGADTGLLDRALRVASSPRDRQVIAVAAAFLAREADRVQVLAGDHLVDHPDSVLVAWLASCSTSTAGCRRPSRPHHPQEES